MAHLLTKSSFDPFAQVVPLEQSLHGRRSNAAPKVAPSRHDPAGVFLAHHLNQIAAKLRE
jgi:hypothetical protein